MVLSGYFHFALPCLALSLLGTLSLTAQPAEIRPEIGLGLGLDLGLDRIVRGSGLDASLRFRSPDWLPGLVLGIKGDRGLGSWWASVALSIPLGSGLEALIGGDRVIGNASLTAGAGRTLTVATEGFPSRFGLAARLGRAPIAGSWSWDFHSGIDWRVLYAREAHEGSLPAAFVRTDSIATFVAGFTARLELRLVLCP
jgi:hypothetical protein